MTLQTYEEKKIIPSAQYTDKASTLGFKGADAATRLNQRLQGIENAAVKYAEPKITEETVQTALKDVQEGRIDSHNVAMVAQQVYKKTANDAFVADMQVAGTNIAKQIEAQQIESGLYDVNTFKKAWDSFKKQAVSNIQDADIKENVSSNIDRMGSQYMGSISTLQAKQQRERQVTNLNAKMTLDTEASNNAFGVNNNEYERLDSEINKNLQTQIDAGMITVGEAIIKKKKMMKGNVLFNMQRNLVSAVDRGEGYQFYDKFKKVDTQKYEGFRNDVYKDKDGNDTIGYGHKLTASEKRSGVYKNGITKSQAEALYKKDKEKHTAALYKEYPELASQPQQVRDALEDMAFNMGVGTRENKKGLSSFESVFKALQQGDYITAGNVIRNSKYARQVGQRAIDNAERIEMGILSPTERESFRDNIQKYIAHDVGIYNKILKQQEDEAKAIENDTVNDFNDQLISGTLDMQTVDTALQEGKINLSTHDTYMKKINQKGPAFDNQQKVFSVETHLLDYTEDEIMNAPDITYQTKSDLIQKRRSSVEDTGNWLSTQSGREASRRIKTTFNIVEGTMMSNFDFNNQNMKDYDRLSKKFYAEVEALPIEQRASKSITIADKLITEYNNNKEKEKQQRIQSIEYKKKADEEASKKAYDDSTIGKFSNMIKRQWESMD